MGSNKKSDQEGWIKLHRKLEDWGWADKPLTAYTFIRLVLRANHADAEWHGVMVRRGQTIVGYKKFSQETGISVQSLRTAFEHLESTREITRESTRSFSLVTIVNYDEYQLSENAANTPINTQSNKQPTTNKKNKNISSSTIVEESITGSEDEPVEVAKHIFLSPKQTASLLSKLSQREYEYWLNELSTAFEAKPKYRKEYKNHASVMTQWRKRRLEEGKVWNEDRGLYVWPNRSSNNGSGRPITKAQEVFEYNMAEYEKTLKEAQ